MMRKTVLIALLALFCVNVIHAQRFTDNLDRGLVAIDMNGTIFVSWRILPDEYYGCTYQLYKNGELVGSNLAVSNYTLSGSSSDTFTVTATVNGEVRSASTKAKWKKSGDYQAGYVDFTLQPVLDRNGNDKTHHYNPNDAIFADLDGDGQLDFIVKRSNRYDEQGRFIRTETTSNGSTNDVYMNYPTENTTEFSIWDAYKLDWDEGTATRLWWVDMGPNMVSPGDVEANLLAYDWDMDGKAEVVMRGADNMVFHLQDGSSVLIGDAVNTRDFNNNRSWTQSGNEYLIYFNGETGRPYQVMEYPLKRYEPGENPNDIDAAWHGQGQYGHVSTKHFFGAPYLDGRKPSLFIGRGIYTRHKMIAFDIDSDHHLNQRWEWHSTADGTTPGSYWYGNGNHNYVIADVDEDGRDEIIYGNMVIDDNGKGLNSTGYGHGDAMHVNDFDPYRKGLEIYNCIEDAPAWGMSFRSGLTGEVYKKYTSTGDDGRALAGNFIEEIPGSLGKTAASTALALTSGEYVGQYDNVFTNVGGGGRGSKINYRIYWDGDLLSELFDGVGASGDPYGRPGMVFKWDGTDTYRVIQSVMGNTNNGTKNNPAFQGDIIGDWREEIVMRILGETVTETHDWDQVPGKTYTYTECNTMRVTTTAFPTSHPIYNLWADHQYRQAMGTQMQTYNLPPNASFFLGEMEGITQAPPPLMNRGREEVRNGGVISTALDGKHVMLAETGNAQVEVAEGVSPKIFTDNAPWWVQGNNPSESQTLTEASTTIYTHVLTGAPFTGETMVVKQGDGVLVLPGEEQTYTGDTKVWAGTLQYDGRMTNSAVWLNRFAVLSSNGGEFKNVTAEYGSEILPGGPAANVGEVTIENLSLGFGARVVLDLNGLGVGDNDQIHVTNLTLETKTGGTWESYGPKNLKPVFQFNTGGVLPGGNYPIGTLANLPANVSGGVLTDVVIEGIDANRDPHIEVNGGVISLVLNNLAPTAEPEIAIIDMVQTDLTNLYLSSTPTSYYMPKVGVSVDDVNGVKPTLNGVFTDLYGNVTKIESQPAMTHYNIDYTANGAVSDWDNGGNGQCTASMANDNVHGDYVSFARSGSGNRYTYWNISSAPVTSENYTVEFDAALGYSNTNNTYNDNELILYGNTPSVDSKSWMFGGTNYLFRISGGKKKGTSYRVTEDPSKTVTLNNLGWAHYKITVNQASKEVSYQVTGGTTISGSYALDPSVSTNMSGIFISLAREGTGGKIDNIVITSPEINFSEFTFKKPGTLRVTAVGSGVNASNYKTFIVENPYVKSGDGEDFYTEAFDGVTAVPSRWTSPSAAAVFGIKDGYLSLDLSEYPATNRPGGSRSAYCNLTSGANNIGIDADVYTIDFDAKLKPGNSDPSTGKTQNQVALLAGGLPSTNALATSNLLFSAVNEGQNSTNYTVSTSGDAVVTIPSDAWCHYHFTIDKTQRTMEWTITNKDGARIGGGKDDIPQETGMDVTYLYFVAGRYIGGFGIDNICISPYSDFIPVSVHDELLASLPNAVTDGNVHLWRTGLNADTSWTSLVLPFDMTSEQITQVFGEEAQVANLVTDKGNDAALYFETVSRTIHANKPVLIKGVTRSAPYLIKGITSNPVAVPVVQNSYYRFIGNYDNKGAVPFQKDVDYVYVNDGLASVSHDGECVVLNGYRGYFHGNNTSPGDVSAFFDAQPLLGDVNGDGSVNITDVTQMVNYILDNNTVIVFMNSDVNGDGQYNIADVTLIVNIILSGN